ncbi:MAG: hypothetical protein SGARI_005229, partial [Bacillariaceae sp.]
MKLFSFSSGSPLVVLCIATAAVAASMAQDYDYDDGGYAAQQGYGGYEQDGGGYGYEQEDTLYQDYAKHQEDKAMGVGGG